MYFKSRDEILKSGILSGVPEIEVSDNVLKATRLERRIYRELRKSYPAITEYERLHRNTLPTIKSLLGDVFQAFYTLTPQLLPDDKLSETAKAVNKKIVKELLDQPEYKAKKSVCEGCELPATEAALTFMKELMRNLDQTVKDLTGKEDRAEVMEDMAQVIAEMRADLKRKIKNPDIPDKKIIIIANRLVSKQNQLSDLEKLAERSANASRKSISCAVALALNRALDQAENMKSALISWGCADGNMSNSEENAKILEIVSKSDKLKYIAKFLGRYKEMYSARRKNGYAFGRGEKYDITTGQSISKALTSEMSLLSDSRLIPLFIHKYRSKKLKQYRKREPIFKGEGDIIVCLDESSSTYGDNQAWGMAIAMMLLQICRDNKRSFALIHFSTDIKKDIFMSTDKDIREHMLKAAQTYLGGDTDFEPPIREAMDMIDKGTLKNPDIIFITDGACGVSDKLAEEIKKRQTAGKFSITGILLDKGRSFDFSLKKFCRKIYRTSELCEDDIAVSLIKDRE